MEMCHTVTAEGRISCGSRMTTSPSDPRKAQQLPGEISACNERDASVSSEAKSRRAGRWARSRGRRTGGERAQLGTAALGSAAFLCLPRGGRQPSQHPSALCQPSITHAVSNVGQCGLSSAAGPKEIAARSLVQPESCSQHTGAVCPAVPAAASQEAWRWRRVGKASRAACLPRRNSGTSAQHRWWHLEGRWRDVQWGGPEGS